MAVENESPSACWCLWFGMWSTAVGAWARHQPAPCDGSHASICTAQIQRNIWFILHNRKWALIYLSSVVWTLFKIHPKHRHSYFQEAFGNPLCSRGFATSSADLEERGARRFWLQTQISSSSPQLWGQNFKGNPAPAMSQDSGVGSSLSVWVCRWG